MKSTIDASKISLTPDECKPFIVMNREMMIHRIDNKMNESDCVKRRYKEDFLDILMMKKWSDYHADAPAFISEIFANASISCGEHNSENQSNKRIFVELEHFLISLQNYSRVSREFFFGTLMFV